MYRVLIVDDEPLILSGIKFMVDWQKNGCELAGTARNGKQALEAMGQLHPHIVIADINMPVMDGMTLLSQAQVRFPDTVFIMLTNLEEFQLVREALRMRAVDYLTKTQLTPEMLEESLARAQKKVQERDNIGRADILRDTVRVDNRQVLRAAVKRMLSHGVLSREAQAVLQKSGVLDGYGVIRMWLLSEPGVQEADDRQHALRWASEVVGKLAGNCFAHSLTIESDWRYIQLVYWGEGEAGFSGKSVLFAVKLDSVSRTIIGRLPCLLATGLLRGSEQAVRCREQLSRMEGYYYLTGERTLYYDRLPLVEYQPLLVQGSVARLQAELAARNAEGCRALMEQLTGRVRDTAHEKSQGIWLCGELYDVACKAFANHPGEHYFTQPTLGVEEIEHLQTREQVLAWLSKLGNEMGALLAPGSSGHSQMLDKVKQYVQDNLEKRILLQHAAEHVCISPAYLSAQFKKEYQQSFVDYVNQSKIERACRLIREGGYRMNEIGYMLGFENAYYFSRVFRKHMGMSPTEYQHGAGTRREKNDQ